MIGSAASWTRAGLGPSSGLAALGASLAALTLLGASYQPALGQGPILDPVAMAKVTGLVCLAGMLYLGAVAIVLTHSLPRWTLWIILACAVLMRCVLLATPPSLSTDIYRYVWDGRVQAAGINPYRYVPAAPELASLRDEAIYPHINRATAATTIYPPIAEAVFFLVNLTGAGLAGMKVAMTAFEGLAIAVLIYLLPRAGLPRERVVIYAWNPVAVWEIAGNGHVDAVAIGFMALALLGRSHPPPGSNGDRPGGRHPGQAPACLSLPRALAALGLAHAAGVYCHPGRCLSALSGRWRTGSRVPAGLCGRGRDGQRHGLLPPVPARARDDAAAMGGGSLHPGRPRGARGARPADNVFASGRSAPKWHLRRRSPPTATVWC